MANDLARRIMGTIADRHLPPQPQPHREEDALNLLRVSDQEEKLLLSIIAEKKRSVSERSGQTSNAGRAQTVQTPVISLTDYCKAVSRRNSQ